METINSLDATAAYDALLRCCGSRSWVDGMMAGRPFPSDDALLSTADKVWLSLDRADWLEAFSAHPRIGDLKALREKFAATADLCGNEQTGIAGAAEQVLQDLAEGNREYEQRFGHIFIVCAGGKSASEMLRLLRDRLGNEPDAELKNAAAEQAKITRLRLEKL
jgi:2-oxo-4-hydroxy-4-carboxy-5-ureidoimidazoline decarboxylase